MLFLSSFFVRQTNDKNIKVLENRIVVCIDWPNFLANLPIGTSPSNDFSITGGFQKAILWLKQFGKIDDISLFFSTRQQIEIYGPPLHYEQKFNLIYCPRLPSKQKENNQCFDDPVDTTLIRHIQKIIQQEELKITHLCLASGDRDYFPILEKAKKKGLKIIIIAPSRKALSKKLERCASLDFLSEKKMIYIFSPTSI